MSAPQTAILSVSQPQPASISPSGAQISTHQASFPSSQEKRRLSIPNMDHILGPWDQGINKHYETFHTILSKDLKRYSDNYY